MRHATRLTSRSFSAGGVPSALGGQGRRADAPTNRDLGESARGSHPSCGVSTCEQAVTSYCGGIHHEIAPQRQRDDGRQRVGLRLSFGVGPLRISVPLTRRKRRRCPVPRTTRSRRQPSPSGRTKVKAWAWAIRITALIAIAAASCGSTPSQSPGPSQPASVVSSRSPSPGASTPTPAATPTPAPTRTRSATAAPTHSASLTTQAAAPPPASCYPLTDGGHCYEPGEFCRHSDEGTTGVAGDGEKIKCEDNGGWRWERI
jgi:hypothetical protein